MVVEMRVEELLREIRRYGKISFKELMKRIKRVEFGLVNSEMIVNKNFVCTLTLDKREDAHLFVMLGGIEGSKVVVAIYRMRGIRFKIVVGKGKLIDLIVNDVKSRLFKVVALGSKADALFRLTPVWVRVEDKVVLYSKPEIYKQILAKFGLTLRDIMGEADGTMGNY